MRSQQQRAVVTDASVSSLTLPADSKESAGQVEEILFAYRKAFDGFSEDELLLLDGIILDRAIRKR
jgi:hypothetical protein